jgi:hypothetical protein
MQEQEQFSELCHLTRTKSVQIMSPSYHISEDKVESKY